jgi:hypothetical protein
VPQDYAQEAKWLRKAAEQGDADAQLVLGTLYYSSQGVPQDYVQGADWLRKAANQGLPSAQSLLGNEYEIGQGVPQDYAEAYFWLNLAASGEIAGTKQEGIAKDRDDVASHLMPADLSRAQERARKWWENRPSGVKPQ